jgi:hypothetical protein
LRLDKLTKMAGSRACGRRGCECGCERGRECGCDKGHGGSSCKPQRDTCGGCNAKKSHCKCKCESEPEPEPEPEPACGKCNRKSSACRCEPCELEVVCPKNSLCEESDTVRWTRHYLWFIGVIILVIILLLFALSYWRRRRRTHQQMQMQMQMQMPHEHHVSGAIIM